MRQVPNSAASPPSVEEILKDISGIVKSLDDSQSVLDSLVRLVARMLKVDRVSLMLVDPDSDELRMRSAYGVDAKVMREYRARLGEGIAGWVAVHGRPLLITDIENHPLFGRVSPKRYATKSLLSVPLLFREKVIGVLNVNNKADGEVFSRSDELLLSTAANLVVIALEKAKLREVEAEKERIDADLRLAQEIQRVFLPRVFPSDGGLEFAAHCASAFKVAGDFYDIVHFSDGRIGLVLGDVCGKGIASALYMARVMSYFRAVAGMGQPPEALLPAVNRFLASEWTSLAFVTACLVVVDRECSSVSVYNAGHLPPYLFSESSGDLRTIEVDSGFPLGVEAECRFDPTKAALHGGDCLVLYTDGITEAENSEGKLFGRALLERTIRAHRGGADILLRAIVESVGRFGGGRRHADDQTIVVVRKLEAAQSLRPDMLRTLYDREVATG